MPLSPRRTLTLVALALMLFPISTVHAQRRGNNPEFDREAPQIGEPLPDVTVFDADGNELSLRSIKDNYSVIVFGCLT